MLCARNALRAAFALALAALLPSTAAAGPPFQWDSFDVKVGHADCVKRAPVAIATEIAAKEIRKRPNGAAAWTDNTSIVVHCVGVKNNRSKGIIFVSGYRRDPLNGTLVANRSALQSGIFE